METRSARCLLKLHVAIGDELRTRGIVSTQNNLTGELAEYIFVKAFDWHKAPNSQKGYDAFDAISRFQIKARRQSHSGGVQQLGAIRDLNGFDLLAAVIFDHDYDVIQAALIPVDVVRGRSKYVKHTNSWRFMFDKSVLQITGVTDVTGELASLDY